MITKKPSRKLVVLESSVEPNLPMGCYLCSLSLVLTKDSKTTDTEWKTAQNGWG